MSRFQHSLSDVSWVGGVEGSFNGHLDYQQKRQDTAEAFRTVFKNGLGPQVLDSLRSHAYGPPRFEIGAKDMVEISLIRGGLHEMVEFIDYQIKLAEQGEYNEGEYNAEGK